MQNESENMLKCSECFKAKGFCVAKVLKNNCELGFYKSTATNKTENRLYQKCVNSKELLKKGKYKNYRVK